MDLEWNDRRTRQFVCNVGLITSDGPNGPNVMAAEWTYHVSYSPSLIMINIHKEDATAENILKSKEFGVNLTAENQNHISSIAGNSSGSEVDKIAVLKELGVEFYQAKHINAPMIKGAAMHAECKLLKHEPLGDHHMFVGEVVELDADENIKPAVYHNGKYWKIGENIPRPSEEMRDRIKALLEKHKK